LSASRQDNVEDTHPGASVGNHHGGDFISHKKQSLIAG
jgi:hypothetical protein